MSRTASIVQPQTRATPSLAQREPPVDPTEEDQRGETDRPERDGVGPDSKHDAGRVAHEQPDRDPVPALGVAYVLEQADDRGSHAEHGERVSPHRPGPGNEPGIQGEDQTGDDAGPGAEPSSRPSDEQGDRKCPEQDREEPLPSLADPIHRPPQRVPCREDRMVVEHLGLGEGGRRRSAPNNRPHGNRLVVVEAPADVPSEHERGRNAGEGGEQNIGVSLGRPHSATVTGGVGPSGLSRCRR